MSDETAQTTRLGVVPTLWFTVACNLATLLFAVVLFALGGDSGGTLWLPVTSLAASALVGLASLARYETRPFGLGCLAGFAVSVVVFAVLFVVFFVTYFIVPGGHELS